MEDPQTGDLREFRFLEDYTESPADGMWEITMRLEMMTGA